MISEFLEYFFNKKNKGVEKFQRRLIETINEYLQESNKIILNVRTILNFFQCCKEVRIEPILDNIELKDVKSQKTQNWKKEIIYISNDDIDSFISLENKQKIIDIITHIYAIFDMKFLFDFFQSKNQSYYCNSLLGLLIDKTLSKKDFDSILDDKEIKFIQEKLIQFANNRIEINKIIQLSNGLTNCLIFIKTNLKKICTILEKENKYYRLDYVLPLNGTKEDVIQIYIQLKGIFDFSEIAQKFIDINSLFRNLMDFYTNKIFK